jgi:MFS family permease
LIASRVLLGVAFAGAGPLAFGVAAAETGVDRRGGAIGLLFASRTLAVALAAFSGGLLAEWLSIRGLFLLSGALVGGYLALFARSRSRVEAST